MEDDRHSVIISLKVSDLKPPESLCEMSLENTSFTSASSPTTASLNHVFLYHCVSYWLQGTTATSSQLTYVRLSNSNLKSAFGPHAHAPTSRHYKIMFSFDFLKSDFTESVYLDHFTPPKLTFSNLN